MSNISTASKLLGILFFVAAVVRRMDETSYGSSLLSDTQYRSAAITIWFWIFVILGLFFTAYGFYSERKRKD